MAMKFDTFEKRLKAAYEIAKYATNDKGVIISTGLYDSVNVTVLDNRNVESRILGDFLFGSWATEEESNTEFGRLMNLMKG